MADGVLGSSAFIFFIRLDKASVVKKGANDANLDNPGGKRLVLKVKTMYEPGGGKCDSTGVLQVMVLGIAGTVTWKFAVKEKNYIVVSIFDKRRIQRRVDQ